MTYIKKINNKLLKLHYIRLSSKNMLNLLKRLVSNIRFPKWWNNNKKEVTSYEESEEIIKTLDLSEIITCEDLDEKREQTISYVENTLVPRLPNSGELTIKKFHAINFNPEYVAISILDNDLVLFHIDCRIDKNILEIHQNPDIDYLDEYMKLF